jgi:hypothetical protein
MDTAYALETQLRDNGFAGTAEIYNNDGSGLVTCDEESDIDGDSVPDNVDNCPNDYNPGQEDADNDNVGDVCDEVHGDISGTVSGDVLENTYVLLYEDSCGTSDLLEYVFVDTDGNYSFTNLSNGNYRVKPVLTGYTFSPSDQILTFSSTPVTGVDFISLN